MDNLCDEGVKLGYSIGFPIPYIWYGNTLVYSWIRSLEQLVRNDGLRGLGDGVRRIIIRTEEQAHVRLGYPVRWNHPVCVWIELDGSANQSLGPGPEIPVADVSCGGYSRGLWLFRNQLFDRFNQPDVDEREWNGKPGYVEGPNKGIEPHKRDVALDWIGVDDNRDILRRYLGE